MDAQEIIPAVLAQGTNALTGHSEQFVRRGDVVYILPGRRGLTADAFAGCPGMPVDLYQELRAAGAWEWAEDRP